MFRLRNRTGMIDPIKASCATWLWRDAGLIGAFLLVLNFSLRKTMGYVLRLLLLLGVVDASRVSETHFGLNSFEYLILYSCLYVAAVGLPTGVFFLTRCRRRFPHKLCGFSTRPLDVMLGVLAAFGACMVANIVSGFIQSFLEQYNIPNAPSYLIMDGENQAVLLMMNLFAFCLLPAVFEELAFRGYILRTLRPYGEGLAWVVTSFLFGLTHANVSQGIFAFIVGLALGWLYIKTDNLLLCIVVHFLNNAFSVLIKYGTSFLSESSAYAVHFFSIVGIGLAGTVAFAVLLMKRSRLVTPFRRFSVLPLERRLLLMMVSPLFAAGVLSLAWTLIRATWG